MPDSRSRSVCRKITFPHRRTRYRRPQEAVCDRGAFESRGFTFGTLTGTNQYGQSNAAFASTLGLTVSDPNNEPVRGGHVTFTINPGRSGASATYGPVGATGCALSSPTVAVCPIGAGGAGSTTTSPRLTANGTQTIFSVTASASGAASVTYRLVIGMPHAKPAPVPTHVIPGMPIVAPPMHMPGMALAARVPRRRSRNRHAIGSSRIARVRRYRNR